ncbi:hypothetical protein ACQ4PT_010699 [Festuca glaucescens]
MKPVNPFKHSKTPKSRQKSTTKFKRMKQRLQYKSVSVGNGHKEQSPLQSVPPLHDVHPIAFEPAPTVDCPSVEEEIPRVETNVAPKKEKVNLFNRSSPMKVVIGFLIEHFDPVACVLDFGARGKIPVDVQSVVSVMAVPMGSFPVPYKQNIDATNSVLEMMGINNGKQPTLTAVEKHPKCYPAVINTEAIPRLNWARFIIDILIQTANAKGNKNWFKACMPYLMVLYVDSSQTDAVDVPVGGPRICVWTNKLIRRVVDLDTNTDGSFGKLPLKACFKNKPFLFSAEPFVVDMFIKRHAPVSPNDEQMVIYREAVSSVCSVFEDGLAEFVRSFAINSGKESTENLHQAEEDVQNISKQKRRRRVPHVTEGENQKEVLLDHMAGTTEVEVALEIGNVAKSKKRKADDRFIAAARPKKKKKMKGSEISPKEHVVIEDHQENIGTEDHQEEATANLFEEKTPDCQTEHKVGNSELAEDEQQTQSNVQIEEPVEVNKDVSAIAPQETEVSLPHTNMGDALRNLQFYGTGSQSSTKTPPAENPMEGSKGNQVEEGSQGSGQLKTRRKKTDSFSPIGRRPVTRSMSPIKSLVVKQDLCSVSSSPRRLTRFSTAEARANASLNKVSNSPSSAQCHKPIPAVKLDRGMTKELVVELESVKTPTETEHQRKVRELEEHCPSFDLGFSQVEETVPEQKESEQAVAERAVAEQAVAEQTVPEQPVPEQTVAEQAVYEKTVAEQTLPEQDSEVQEVIVISSNEDSGDSLDKIYAAIEMPSSSGKGIVLQNAETSPRTPGSSTPIPQSRRIVKLGPQQKSPFIANAKKPSVPKSDSELYNKVNMYGGRSKDLLNGERIIDYGGFFIYLCDLADSVKPGVWLSNSTCEIALQALSPEMAKQKKFVMPLRIATKLRSAATCLLDRSVKKAFKCSPTHRLDHKDMILFSVLQDLTPDLDVMTGHYYLIVLNLKSGRFEVMDSMRREGDAGLMKDSRTIIGSIKHLWATNYSESKIDISKYKTVHISTPMQDTKYDCGYFLLKFIEEWNGRKMLPFSASDMPALRKLNLNKWVDFHKNTINWEELLFP